MTGGGNGQVQDFPLISIVVPSFNQGQYLAGTLDSILEQSRPPFEVIVIDGASTDDSVRVLEEYGNRYPNLQWISEPDSGPADAVNKGLARVQGDWVGICSADDQYLPGVFEILATSVVKHPAIGFIYGELRLMDVDGNPLPNQTNYPEFSWEAYFGIAACIPQGSIFFSAAVAREAGGWNAEYYGCDLDYWMRLLFRTQAMKIPRVLSYWRTYPEQRTREDCYPRIWKDYCRMIDESADIRGASPRLRRMAEASKGIMALTYPPTNDRRVLRGQLYRALLRHPTFWRYHYPARLLKVFPGYAYLRGLYRALGFRRRRVLNSTANYE